MKVLVAISGLLAAIALQSCGKNEVEIGEVRELLSNAAPAYCKVNADCKDPNYVCSSGKCVAQ